MDIKKILLITLIIVAILGSVSAVSAGLFDGWFGEEDIDKNITLIKESTDGLAYFYDDGEIHAIYSLDGVLKDLPSDVEGYNIRVTIYDENGDFIKDEAGSSMSFVSMYSEKSEPVELGSISMDDYINVSIIELKLFDEDGTIVLDENVTFRMENMNIEKLTEEDYADEYDDSSNSKEYHYWWSDEPDPVLSMEY